jgi:predicted dehydrogenase
MEEYMSKKVYCLVGTGSRSFMYIDALFGPYSAWGTLKAVCDTNRKRMEYVAKYVAKSYGSHSLDVYAPEEFEKMIADTGAHTVIITSIDRTHHEYIIRAMRAGCDVICEKPLTIDCERAEQIFAVSEETNKHLTVTFNYRYAPRNSQVKKLLQDKTIGEITSVHFEWLLDTIHGADYFRRWHRDKKNSGGLMVHKATHHFDLINWWIDSVPKQVFAQGNLIFYGRENAEKRGITSFYARGTDSSVVDPFALNLNADERYRELYLNAEKEDGYQRDQSVFGDGISIEDDMALVISYVNNVLMSYHLTAYSPWEGFRVNFNGTKGRLEYEAVEKAYTSGKENDPNRLDVRQKKEFELKEEVRIRIRPHWAESYDIPVEIANEGGHGGGDDRLLRDLFVSDTEDSLGRAASHIEGGYSILTGIAANESMRKNAPVSIKEMIRDYPTLHRILG